MQLLIVGINHTTAPIALRERVAFAPEQIAEALGDLRKHRGRDASGDHVEAEEFAILSTCNRTEIYCAFGKESHGSAAPDVTPSIQHWLALHRNVPRDELALHLYSLEQADAVRHAFRVAAGLDSMVLGEPQILGQFKDAARDADGAGTFGHFLRQWFQRSFFVAKGVRSNTGIGAASVSMAAAAVRLSQRIFESLSEQEILFVGAGEMIELCATHFAAAKPKSITIANRNIERSHSLAERFGGQSMRLSDLPEHLSRFDIVVSCTAASLPIIGLGMVERATRQRRHKPMFMVDLAVPRDIEHEVGRLDDVFLYSVDDLGKMVALGLEQRRAAVAGAEAIIEREVRDFMHWLDTRHAVPAIRSLHDSGEAIRAAELERARKMLARGTDPALVLESLSQGITNKFLHGPTQLLQTAPDEVRAHLLEYLPTLFKTSERK